jgi:hypothetical protein
MFIKHNHYTTELIQAVISVYMYFDQVFAHRLDMPYNDVSQFRIDSLVCTPICSGSLNRVATDITSLKGTVQ